MLDTHFSTIRLYCLVDKCGLPRTRLGNRKSVSARWWLAIHAPTAARVYAAGGRYVPDGDSDQVAASKLAVDGEIEESQIPVSA